MSEYLGRDNQKIRLSQRELRSLTPVGKLILTDEFSLLWGSDTNTPSPAFIAMQEVLIDGIKQATYFPLTQTYLYRLFNEAHLRLAAESRPDLAEAALSLADKFNEASHGLQFKKPRWR